MARTPEEEDRFAEMLRRTLPEVFAREHLQFSNGSQILFQKIARGEPLTIEQRYRSVTSPIVVGWDFGVDHGAAVAMQWEPDGRVTVLQDLLVDRAALDAYARQLDAEAFNYPGFENFDGTIYTTNHANQGNDLTLADLDRALRHWREHLTQPPDLAEEAREMLRLRMLERCHVPEVRPFFVGIPDGESVNVTSGTHQMGGTTFHWVRYRGDRAQWGRGEWETEEWDKVLWKHRGLWCMARRNSFGAWCGYVLLEPGDPARKRVDTDLGTYLQHAGCDVVPVWSYGVHISENTLPARAPDPSDMFAMVEFSQDNCHYWPLADDPAVSGGWSTYISLSAALRLTERLAVMLHPWLSDGKANRDSARE